MIAEQDIMLIKFQKVVSNVIHHAQHALMEIYVLLVMLHAKHATEHLNTIV